MDLDEITFSQQLKHSGGHVQFSPNGKYIAAALDKRVVIRNPVTLDVIAHHSCIDNVTALQWAPNSELFLCASSKKSVVQVFSVSDAEWHCRVKEGLAGLTSVHWAPDSLHILTFSDFNLHLTVWSLVTQNMFIIRQPKGCFTFSSDDEVMAVATRRSCKDWISMYQLEEETWQCQIEFQLETLDVESISFSPNNSSIIAFDTELHYLFQVYSLDGTLLASYKAYDDALGIRVSSVSPSGYFVAVGSYDQSTRLISPLTWKPVLEYKHVTHPMHLPSSSLCPDITYHCEVDEKSTEESDSQVHSNKENLLQNSLRRIGSESEISLHSFLKNNSNSICLNHTNKVKSLARRSQAAGKPIHATKVTFASELPSQLPCTTPDYRKANPKLGVGLLSWSYTGRYLATRNDNMPRVLWIWDSQSIGLRAIVAFLEPIRSMKWQPQDECLALCTGNQRLYLWNPSGLFWLDAPDGFEVHGMRWSEGSGSMLALLAKDKATICYMEKDEDGRDEH
mmetsp:Transcript_30164/g.39737  ORF Transcript_30164/g.39737 Transcript_30164/m.39737 type:complete len:508 (-) Transcript_30164:107-1630(-)